MKYKCCGCGRDTTQTANGRKFVQFEKTMACICSECIIDCNYASAKAHMAKVNAEKTFQGVV